MTPRLVLILLYGVMCACTSTNRSTSATPRAIEMHFQGVLPSESGTGVPVIAHIVRLDRASMAVSVQFVFSEMEAETVSAILSAKTLKDLHGKKLEDQTNSVEVVSVGNKTLKLRLSGSLQPTKLRMAGTPARQHLELTRSTSPDVAAEAQGPAGNFVGNCGDGEEQWQIIPGPDRRYFATRSTKQRNQCRETCVAAVYNSEPTNLLTREVLLWSRGRATRCGYDAEGLNCGGCKLARQLKSAASVATPATANESQIVYKSFAADFALPVTAQKHAGGLLLNFAIGGDKRQVVKLTLRSVSRQGEVYWGDGGLFAVVTESGLSERVTIYHRDRGALGEIVDSDEHVPSQLVGEIDVSGNRMVIEPLPGDDSSSVSVAVKQFAGETLIQRGAGIVDLFSGQTLIMNDDATMTMAQSTGAGVVLQSSPQRVVGAISSLLTTIGYFTSH